MKQQFESVRSGFLLLLAAFIWGIAFVAQSVGMDYMGPCTFNASRFLIGGVVLLPVIWTKERMEAKKAQQELLRKKINPVCFCLAAYAAVSRCVRQAFCSSLVSGIRQWEKQDS